MESSSILLAPLLLTLPLAVTEYPTKVTYKGAREGLHQVPIQGYSLSRCQELVSELHCSLSQEAEGDECTPFNTVDDLSPWSGMIHPHLGLVFSPHLTEFRDTFTIIKVICLSPR